MWNTYLETLQAFGSRHLVGWMLQDVVCVSRVTFFNAPSGNKCREAKPPHGRRTSNCDQLKNVKFNSLKEVQELLLKVHLHVRAPKRDTWQWLVALHASPMASGWSIDYGVGSVWGPEALVNKTYFIAKRFAPSCPLTLKSLDLKSRQVSFRSVGPSIVGWVE